MALGKMPEVVHNDLLLLLSDELTTRSWRNVGRCLGIPDATIDNIESQHQGDQKEMNYRILQKWKHIRGKGATYNVLEDALERAQRLDLSQLVVEEANKLRQPKRSHDAPSGTVSKKLMKMATFKTEDQAQNYGENLPLDKQMTTSHEDTPYALPSDIKEIFDSFIEDLKKTYQRLAKKVRPVPYSNVSRCVGDIFVASNLEVMEQTLFELKRERWKPVDSYYDIVCDDANRLLLDGEPGYGKSTLALQMAYEWCQALDGCPMIKIDIFILIRLREVQNVNSIFRVIKLLLLPKDSKTKEEDIQEILSIPQLRVVFIMEGFDEFTLAGEDCDVSSIIKGDMYPDRKVVITTRPDCTQSLLDFVDRRMRLNGFDERIQDIYIKKVVFHSESDKEKGEKMIKVFRENDLLADISQVPLLFVMFAHLLKEEPELERQQSITAFYSYMIKCFRGHMKNKEPSELKGSRGITKRDRPLELKVSEVAFQGLVSKNQTMWDKDTLVNVLGIDGYEQYKNVGILVEEEVVKDYHNKGQHLHDTVVNEVTGRFFHKTVQEYYAALYLVNLMKDKNGNEVNEYLKNLNPKNVVYFFLFTCGLDDNIANFVVDFLVNVEKRHGYRLGLKPAILSVNEIGDLIKLKECISRVCAEGITIESTNTTKHLQRASFELIKTASKHKIPVEVVQLDDLFGSVNTQTGNFETITGFNLPRLRFVKRLHLRDNGREWTGDDFQHILRYATSCDGLECITFSNCLVPLDVDDGASLPNSTSTKILVRWNSPHQTAPPYELYLNPFRWERGSSERPVPGFQEELLLQPEYEWLENEFRRCYRDSEWQKTHISTLPENRNCVEEGILFMPHAEWACVYQALVLASQQTYFRNCTLGYGFVRTVLSVQCDLSCDIKDEWRDIAARLQMSDTLINAISCSSTNKTSQQKAYRMLLDWQKLRREHASPQVLERVLRGASKYNLVDKLNTASLEDIQSLKVTPVKGGKGGVITLAGTDVELRIPHGAIHGEHKVQMRVLPHYLFDEPATCFEDHTTVMVEISPYDLRLQRPASLFLPHCLKLTDFKNHDVQVFHCYGKPDPKPVWEDVTKSVSFSLSEFGCKIQIERFCSVKYIVRGGGVEAKRLTLYAMGERCNDNSEYVTTNIGYHPDLPGENKVYQETFREKFQGDSQTFLFFKEPCSDLTIFAVGTLPVWKRCHVTGIPMKIPYLRIESSVQETCSFTFKRPQPSTTLPRCVFEISGNPKRPQYRLTVNFRSLQPPVANKTLVTDEALFVKRKRASKVYLRREIGSLAEKMCDRESLVSTMTLSDQIQDVWEDIGRRLQEPESDLKDILNENNSRQEKTCKMLMAWKRRVGQVAFSEVLEGVLRDKAKHEQIDVLRKAIQTRMPDSPVSSVDPQRKHPLKASEVISQDGGVVQINGTGVELHFPPDAFHGFTGVGHTIQLRILPHHAFDDPVKCFEDHSTVMVEVLPSDLELKRSARLFLPHCLKLKSAIHSEVRIFKSHHNADHKPFWEDITTSVTYSLSGSYCEIRIKRFCWIKYTIRGQVKAKTLTLYTEVKKFEEDAASVTIDVGCYPNLPGGNKVPKEALQGDFYGDEREFCFFKEPQNDLHISLAKCPTGWRYSGSPKHVMKIPYQTVQNSIETNRHFLFKWDGRTSSSSWCEFEVFQDKQQSPRRLTMTFAPPRFQSSFVKQRPVTASVLMFLSGKITQEWKDIARRLQISEGHLHMISADCWNHQERVYQMLSTWKQIQGSAATIDELGKALRDAERSDLAQTILKQ